MLTFSVQFDEPARKIGGRNASSGKQHHGKKDVPAVGGLSLLRNATAKEDKSGNRRAVCGDESSDAQSGIDDGFYHSKISPVAKILLVEHAAILKMIEMSLLGAIVFSICFAVTAGL